MNALRWALQNLRLRPESEGCDPGSFVVLHAQSPPSIAAGLNPGSIPFGGPSRTLTLTLTLIPFEIRTFLDSVLIRSCGGAGVHGGDRGAPEEDHGGDHHARVADLQGEECEFCSMFFFF